MSTLRISDAPLLPDVEGTEKIPTGGRGDYAISVDQIKDHIFQDVGKELVGLGNVDNTSDLDKPVSTAQQAALNLKADKTYVDTNLDLKADKTSVYTRSETSLALSKKADLVNGVVPENQIPSSFNDVLEFTTNTLPVVGESGKIYVTTDTNRTWRWSGNQYVEISNGGVSDSTLKLQTARKIANVEFDGTQNIDVPHNNLINRNVANAHVAEAISTATGEDQQTINDYNGVKWRNKVSGYTLNARVMLDNGDIVKSTVAGNTANPNVDMTGWFNAEMEQRGIKTYLDNFPFYIPFSQSVSDYASAFKTAIESGRPIVLTENATYPFLTPVSTTVTKGVTVHGNNVILSYDGATHIGDFIKISSSVAVKHYFYLTHIDGNHKATRCLYIESSQNNSDGESEFYFNNSSVKRAKRLVGAGFIGGSGIHVRGAFRQISSEYSHISDCMLGTGAGTSGSVGISGFTVTHLTSDSYPVEMTFNGGGVDKIYSEDPSYTDDQDGLVFFSSTSTTKAGKKRSIFRTMGAEFRNCWGRSIKTQCRKSIVTATNFYRNEGFTTLHGNGEVDIQTGQGEVFGNTYEYENGYTGGACVNFGSDASAKRASTSVYDNDVYLDANTVLPRFLQSTPRDGKLGVCTVTDNKVFGKVINFARFYVRGDRNLAILKGNYVETIELDSNSERNFIEVRSSGSVSGETNYLNIEVENNINDGVEAILVRDGVTGVGMNTSQSGRNNIGFKDDGSVATTQGQKTLVPFRATAYAGKDGGTFYSSISGSISAGATRQFTLPPNTSLLNIQVRGVQAASAIVSHGSTGAVMSQVGTTNVVYSSGTTEPSTQGTWLTMWRDATDPNIINVKNNNTSSRFVSIHYFTS